ncbi:ferritin-like domain-containing protein [Luedemannella helvata]|uniref:Ferritin-like domain-containing protein n=1 Tax=Luedemannella helvata TaxID=349315 RepID=A0ABP4WWA5_9ACTN
MSDANAALAAALTAEHAAIFGYGVVGGHLDNAGKETARRADTVHRTRRDALIARLASTSATAPPAAPAYTLPFAVTNRSSAYKLAIAIEEGTAEAWRLAIAATTGDVRKVALDALIDCAVRATGWRRAAKLTPTTVPFPGVRS